MRKIVLVSMFMIVLVGCGGPSPAEISANETSTALQTSIDATTTALQASIDATTTSVLDCQKSAVTYETDMRPILLEWEDQVKLADSTGRGNLPPQIQALQSIKRKAEAVTVPPCALKAHENLTMGMNKITDGYIGFMSQGPEATYKGNFIAGFAHIETYKLEIQKAMTLPTPVPDPTKEAVEPTATP